MKVEINFEQLQKNYTSFYIDSSSLIYLEKANILENVLKIYKLLVLNEIKDEIAQKDNFLIFYEKDNNIVFLDKYNTTDNYNDIFKSDKLKKYYKKLSKNDLILIFEAFNNNLPVITEDKNIMHICDFLNIPYFNSLIIVYFLVKRKIYSKKEGIKKLFKLSTIGWYSEKVFDIVFNLIDKI